MPELIHHQVKVVELICKQMSAVVVQDLPAYFKLVSVLARSVLSFYLFTPNTCFTLYICF